jgi:hypothetical protein
MYMSLIFVMFDYNINNMVCITHNWMVISIQYLKYIFA